MTEVIIPQYTNLQELQKIKDKIGTILILWANYHLPQCDGQEGLVAHKEEIIELLKIDLWKNTQRPESAKCIIESMSSQDSNWWYIIRKTLQMIQELLALEIEVIEPIEKEKQEARDQLNIAYTKISDIQAYIQQNPDSETNRNRTIKQNYKKLLEDIGLPHKYENKNTLQRNIYIEHIIVWIWKQDCNIEKIFDNARSVNEQDIEKITKVLKGIKRQIANQQRLIQSE